MQMAAADAVFFGVGQESLNLGISNPDIKFLPKKDISG